MKDVKNSSSTSIGCSMKAWLEQPYQVKETTKSDTPSIIRKKNLPALQNININNQIPDPNETDRVQLCYWILLPARLFHISSESMHIYASIHCFLTNCDLHRLTLMYRCF